MRPPPLRLLQPRVLFPAMALVCVVTATLLRPAAAQAQPGTSATTSDASAPAASATSAAPAATTSPAAATAQGRRGGGGARGGNRGPQTGLRLQNISLHDPFILADDKSKTYYLYNAGGRGVVYYKSKDLASWDGPYTCFSVPTDSWAAQEGPWAPEVHAYKGKYYLFTTLHNSQVPVPPGGAFNDNPRFSRHMRSTTISVSDSPEGPFVLIKKDDTTTPHNFMTIDGTFYTDPQGKPWMVYAHEWVQKIDGTIEAIPLKDDLSNSAGDPMLLFKASDAPWLNATRKPSVEMNNYVTDGPEIFRTKDGHLLILWSSYKRSPDNTHDIYVETVARSTTGDLKGPWEQLPILVENDSGHGMLFHTFDGQLLLVIGQPFQNQHAKIYEITDAGDHLVLGKFRDDLSGPPLGPLPGQAL